MSKYTPIYKDYLNLPNTYFQRNAVEDQTLFYSYVWNCADENCHTETLEGVQIEVVSDLRVALIDATDWSEYNGQDVMLFVDYFASYSPNSPLRVVYDSPLSIDETIIECTPYYEYISVITSNEFTKGDKAPFEFIGFKAEGPTIDIYSDKNIKVDLYNEIKAMQHDGQIEFISLCDWFLTIPEDIFNAQIDDISQYVLTHQSQCDANLVSQFA